MNRASVVITSYNHKKYLIEAIESIIHQTVKVHEIIIAEVMIKIVRDEERICEKKP